MNTSMWTVEFANTRKVTLKNPLFVEGLPGIANVGKIAVDFLVEELKAKKLCSFYSYSFPHSVFVNEQNLVEMPKIELYYKKFKDPKKRDLLLLVGDVQPIDEMSCHSFCERLIELLKTLDCSEIITTGGIGLKELPEKPKVYVTANCEEMLTKYTKKNLKVEKQIFGVVGPVIGVSGVLLGVAARHNMKGAALLAQTFAHQMYLGIKGAQEILRVLNTKLKLKLNVSKIGKEVVAIENEVLKKTKEWLLEHASPQQAGGKPRNLDARYIG